MTLLGAPIRATVLAGLTVSFAAVALAACSPSTGDGGGAGAQQNSGSGPGTGGAVNGSGGTVPTGGTTAAAGGTTVGGGGTAVGGGGVTSTGGTFAATGGQPNLPPGCNDQVVDPNTLPPCTGCTGGRCVAKADYPGAPFDILASCDPNTVCLPDPIVATKGNVFLKQCTSVLGNEGRCTSLCIPIAQSLSGVLPQDVCSPDERCAPCINPTDGTQTGVCKVGCDPGPNPQFPPILFQKCCSNRGDCVPRKNIPGAAAGNLSKLDCTGGDDPVCVPSDIVKDPTYRFPACTSSTTVPGVSSGPGVCVPQCIVNANSLGRFLGRGDCANPDDKCAPCNDPTGKPTGACTVP
jgi:hypothetical protein